MTVQAGFGNHIAGFLMTHQAFSCCGPFVNPAVSTDILIIMKVDIIKIYGFVLIINQSLSISLMGFHSLDLEAMTTDPSVIIQDCAKCSSQ